MQWSLVAVVLIVNALLGASCASAENGIGQISSVFEAFGYSPACVASALTSCEFSSTKELSVDVVDSIEVTKSLLQEMKSEIKAIRQEMKSAEEISSSVVKALLQEIKSQVENSSSVVEALLQDRKTELKAITVDTAKQNSAKINPRKNCAELRVLLGDEFSGGVQTVYPYLPNPKPVVVFCDQVTDGGGWTVIQSRSPLPIRENFTRSWKECVEGFGDPNGEFWLVLDHIHALTNSSKMELRVDLETAEGKKAWALYSTFHVGDEASKYVLRIGGYSGTAGDGMTYPSEAEVNSNGMKFSTFDNDNDLDSGSCAERCRSGWWFNSCSVARLNGLATVGEDPYGVGILWYPFRESHSMKKASMKVRPVSLGF